MWKHDIIHKKQEYITICTLHRCQRKKEPRPHVTCYMYRKFREICTNAFWGRQADRHTHRQTHRQTRITSVQSNLANGRIALAPIAMTNPFVAVRDLIDYHLTFWFLGSTCVSLQTSSRSVQLLLHSSPVCPSHRPSYCDIWSNWPHLCNAWDAA